MKSTSTFQQLKSIIALPFMVLVIVPIVINYFTSQLDYSKITSSNQMILYIFGLLLLASGIILFTKSIILFINIGKGTLAPWNPTKKLVVKGLYRYMRNPMIVGVFIILLAESCFYNSLFILIWALLFITINHFYFILKEEPDLLKRFGEEYKEYKENVPRWLPNRKGWRPENFK
ncbi:isoprenylcysteine carboxylmethyltransferase family protein [Aureibaculum sp. 2210JD6-5]|uniref:methyltransferase family protein n=1 Tax=Aureibaculum sp. 2210JD6-5 TaxID=3103957 RepID=UPI002AACC651|nr:isoprenylcysteine carboxylmethyltransferase family protein [Aureibaculum sp. 2210JD6-5]MDY7394770.1 isoprenylcysteine carboxylmethyltransferase family protein [Aureibaculum sp. 2210JD6-5]